MRQRIVYTRYDGGVTVNCPAPRIFRELQHGAWGSWKKEWVDYEIHHAIKDGRNPDGVKRFARAMVKGGVTEREVWALIRDRDCLHKGRLHELQNLDDLPDRWFRDAWRRSHNGGPVGIDLTKARPIQLAKIKEAVAARNTKRIALGRNPIALPWWTLGQAIRHARDAEELKRIWPENVPSITPLNATPPSANRQPDNRDK